MGLSLATLAHEPWPAIRGLGTGDRGPGTYVIIVYYIDYWSILVSQLYRLPYKIKFVRVYTNILPFKLVSNFIPVKTGQQLYINI